MWLCTFIFVRVVNMVFKHVYGYKCCDQMWAVWMLKIWIIIVIIVYFNGHKCCGLCSKCYNLKMACSKHSAGQTWPSIRPCLWPCASMAVEHGQNTWPCSLLSQIFKKLKISSFYGFLHPICIIDHILMCYAWINHLNDL